MMFYYSPGSPPRRCPINWQPKFTLWPRWSNVSNQLIWFKQAYQGRQTITGPGTPVHIDHWMTPAEFVMHQLKTGTP